MAYVSTAWGTDFGGALVVIEGVVLFVPAGSLGLVVASDVRPGTATGEPVIDVVRGGVAFAFALLASFSRRLAGLGAGGVGLDEGREGLDGSPQGSSSQSAPLSEEDA
jgi:hypothetical protein